MRLASQLALAAVPAAPLATLLVAAGVPGRMGAEATFVLTATTVVAAPLLAAALAPTALPSHRPSRIAFGALLMAIVVTAGFAVLAIVGATVVCRPGMSSIAPQVGWIAAAAGGYALASAVAMRHPRALAWAWPLAVLAGILAGALVLDDSDACRSDR